MSIARDDRWVQDAQGNALAAAQVYWCLQPASTADNPPSPLATIYSNLSETPLTQPVLTDGFGHAFAYMSNAVLYTIVVWHPLFGDNPVVLTDQSIGGGGGESSITLFAGVPSGTINGSNTTFILTNSGTPLTNLPSLLTLTLNGITLTAGLGFSGPTLVSGQAQVVLANAPQVGDTLYDQGIIQ